MTTTPEEILAFWYPEVPNPDIDKHREMWMWRMQGGADAEIIDRFAQTTQDAVDGKYDHWADTALGRLALIIVIDQFPRSLWRGTPDAYSNDPKALSLCMEGIENGHYDALEHPWEQTVFTLPMTHCEGEGHLDRMNQAVEMAEKVLENAPEYLKLGYTRAAEQPKKHRKVIETFGRHPHRNDVIGRPSTPEEEIYIAKDDFPHVVKLES